MTIELKCFQKWNGSETLPSTNSFQEVTFGGRIQQTNEIIQKKGRHEIQEKVYITPESNEDRSSNRKNSRNKASKGKKDLSRKDKCNGKLGEKIETMVI